MSTIERAEIHAEIAVAMLRAGRACWGQGGSSSMEPLIGPLDRVLIDPATPTIRRGDLVAVDWDGVVVVHRVVARSRRGCWTKGDASPRVDGLVAWSAVLGRATVIELAEGGRLVLDAFPWIVIQPLLGLFGWCAWRVGESQTPGRFLCRIFRLPFYAMAWAARRQA